MFGFLIAFGAGFVAPHIEKPVAEPIARALASFLKLEEGELRLLAFALAMIAAGVLCAIFDTGGPLGLAVAGTLGYFATRIVSGIRAALDSRKS